MPAELCKKSLFLWFVHASSCFNVGKMSKGCFFPPLFCWLFYFVQQAALLWKYSPLFSQVLSFMLSLGLETSLLRLWTVFGSLYIVNLRWPWLASVSVCCFVCLIMSNIVLCSCGAFSLILVGFYMCHPSPWLPQWGHHDPPLNARQKCWVPSHQVNWTINQHLCSHFSVIFFIRISRYSAFSCTAVMDPQGVTIGPYLQVS